MTTPWVGSQGKWRSSQSWYSECWREVSWQARACGLAILLALLGLLAEIAWQIARRHHERGLRIDTRWTKGV